MELLATSDIRIDGELVLETPRASGPPALPHLKEPAVRDLPLDARDRYLLEVIYEQFGCRLVAAGDVLVRGRIRHHLVGDSPPPLVLLGRRLGVWASIPDGTVLAREEAKVAGTVQGVHQVPIQREPGFSGPMMEAVARTQWVQIPADYDGSTFEAKVEDLSGDLEVSVQVAQPDPFDPKSPYRDPAGLSVPLRLPLRQPVDVGDPRHRNFVRFILRAKVREGHELPSLRALVILGD